jgi:hypothetical protein
MRLRLAVIACSALVTTVAHAAPPRLVDDPPRWRLRLSISEGFGGARSGDAAVARFATTAELGVRVWGPLSLDIGAIGTVAGEFDASCGQGIRPSAIAAVAGVRADAFNARSASWVDPFVEVHGGVGAQAGAREVPGACAATSVFGTGGARAGIDVWLGGAAVTVALSFDYLPIGSTIAFSLGGSFKLF